MNVIREQFKTHHMAATLFTTIYNVAAPLFAPRRTKLERKNKRNLVTSWPGGQVLPLYNTLEGNFSRTVYVKVIWIMAQRFGTTTNEHCPTKLAATLCHNASIKLKRWLWPKVVREFRTNYVGNVIYDEVILLAQDIFTRPP